MRLHIITIGTPKLPFAQAGWNEYCKRLERYHTIHITHLANKWAYDTPRILQAAGTAYTIALAIIGKQFTSEGLADFLATRANEGREVCYIVGGPEGLPQAVLEAADLRWSFSQLTFPHDLAMVILLEALYRASTINTGHPYHKP